MKPHKKVLTALIATAALSGFVYLAINHIDRSNDVLPSIDLASNAFAQQLPKHRGADDTTGGVVVELCDGVTKTEVKGLEPGQSLTHEQALAVTHSLMTEWSRKHPNEHWEMAQGAAESTSKTPVEASTPGRGPGHGPLPVQQGDTYASFNERDQKVWQANTERFIQEGKAVFHDANKLGGTIGISCDMCHPDASNTHPETYPKYQVQLQRVALLRDMIEWCIENPVKGKTMDPNDPRLRAMEAYILSQRKGVPLEYGKH